MRRLRLPYRVDVQERLRAAERRVLTAGRDDLRVVSELRRLARRGISSRELFTSIARRVDAAAVVPSLDDGDDDDREVHSADEEDTTNPDLRLLVAAASIRAHAFAAEETLARCRAWNGTLDFYERWFDGAWPDADVP